LQLHTISHRVQH